jgi:hypothetical protein
MNRYEWKQEQRRERLEARADKLRAESARQFDRADLSEAKTGIPFGQPILVGHHSERRHRKVIERADAAMRRAIDADKAAKATAARAAAVGTGGISSDDPDAVTKLQGQLASLQANQRQMIAINKAWKAAGSPKADDQDGWRKVADDPAVMMNINDLSRVRSLLARGLVVRPFPTYALTNNGANIRRIEGRIAHLQRNATRQPKETLHNSGVRMVENVEDNRLQLFFPGKPAAEVREKLKRAGFRWAPTEGAWQRMLSNGAVYVAGEILKGLVG